MSTEDNKKSDAQRERGGTPLTNPARRGLFMENRVNLGKAAPELYQSIVNLDRLASELAASAGIGRGPHTPAATSRIPTESVRLLRQTPHP